MLRVSESPYYRPGKTQPDAAPQARLDFCLLPLAVCTRHKHCDESFLRLRKCYRRFDRRGTLYVAPPIDFSKLFIIFLLTPSTNYPDLLFTGDGEVFNVSRSKP